MVITLRDAATVGWPRLRVGFIAFLPPFVLLSGHRAFTRTGMPGRRARGHSVVLLCRARIAGAVPGRVPPSRTGPAERDPRPGGQPHRRRTRPGGQGTRRVARGGRRLRRARRCGPGLLPRRLGHPGRRHGRVHGPAHRDGPAPSFQLRPPARRARPTACAPRRLPRQPDGEGNGRQRHATRCFLRGSALGAGRPGRPQLRGDRPVGGRGPAQPGAGSDGGAGDRRRRERRAAVPGRRTVPGRAAVDGQLPPAPRVGTGCRSRARHPRPRDGDRRHRGRALPVGRRGGPGRDRPGARRRDRRSRPRPGG